MLKKLFLILPWFSDGTRA